MLTEDQVKNIPVQTLEVLSEEQIDVLTEEAKNVLEQEIAKINPNFTLNRDSGSGKSGCFVTLFMFLH